jgi:DNA-cytosine methyltransferase
MTELNQMPACSKPLLPAVLSIFDGMSCGQIALNKIGYKYSEYYASEIDKHAIKVAVNNYPSTKQIGSVTEVKAVDLPKIDLLMGGSPCQGFSFSGKQLNFDDPRSKLFFEFVRLKEECEPKWFLLENVVMKKEYEQVITKALGVEPIRINSALVSAQNRERLYWTNIPNITQPNDKGKTTKDIVGFESEIPCIDETISEIKKYTSRDFQVSISKNGRIRPHRFDYKKSGISEIGTIVNPNDKTVTIIASHSPKTYKSNPFEIYPLNRQECEQLQTVPMGYTDCVSEQQAKRMLGNGWTVDVISHILSFIPQ